jgi:hypothetical protein
MTTTASTAIAITATTTRDDRYDTTTATTTAYDDRYDQTTATTTDAVAHAAVS